MSQKNLKEFSKKTGKQLGGGAAQLARIKRYGGWDAYHEEFAKRVTQEVLEDMNKPNLRRVK